MTQIGSSRDRSRSRNRRRSVAKRGYGRYANAAQQKLTTSAWAPSLIVEWGRIPSAVLLGMLVVALYFLFGNLSFYVAGIELVGDKVISAQEIMQATGLRGHSIFYVNTERIAQTIRREFPSISSVKVSCGLPARVRIAVQECEAQAIWVAANGRFLVDREGRALKAAPTPDQGMLVIVDRTGQALRVCEQAPALKGNSKEKTVEPCAANKAAVQTAIALQPLLGDLYAFDYYRDQGISVTSPKGWPVYFGLGGNLELKVANLRGLLGEIASRSLTKIDYIDVRFEKSPFYRQGN